jgi:hypothetical protein
MSSKLNGMERLYEYELVCRFYEDKIAARSRVYKIHHVTEGVYVLNRIGASTAAKRAFCLHPMLQDDKELGANFRHLCDNADRKAVMLALEYRNVANQYLSFRDITKVSEIALSPLEEVNQMLIADKVQNRKDFELYHLKTHPKSERLQQYFINWLERLNVGEDTYKMYVEELLATFPEHAVTR